MLHLFCVKPATPQPDACAIRALAVRRALSCSLACLTMRSARALNLVCYIEQVHQRHPVLNKQLVLFTSHLDTGLLL
jgi:hypothetical protein